MEVSDPARDQTGYFTYKDYRSWPEEERWELIDGIAYNMSAAPMIRHQFKLQKLHLEFATFFKGKPCTVMLAPVDIVLPRLGQSDEEADNVVEPDLFVVCDRSKIEERFVRGAPDLVVEILSPSTSKKDLKEKFELYERSGVREYWVVEPKACWMHRYVREEGGRYGPALVREKGDGGGPFASLIFTGFSIDIDDLFGEPFAEP
jgi:Uma2 family endonuclease